MKREDFKIMENIKIIEEIKADLLCQIGNIFKLLTKGNNITQNALIDCISQEIILLYKLADKLGYSKIEVDNEIKRNIQLGIMKNESDSDEKKC